MQRPPTSTSAPEAVEPASTPTPPPFSVTVASERVASPGGVRVAPTGRSRRGGWRAAWLGAAMALPIAAWVAGAREPAGVATAEVSAHLSKFADAVGAARESASALLLPEPPTPEIRAEAPPSVPAAERADAHLNRDGRYASINGGVLFAPRGFSSEDGAYDLYIHFHGNTRVVLESAEHAGLNALVAIVNLGVGSAPYEEAFAMPGTYQALLDQIQRRAAVRGLAHPHARRIALGTWSAGYGAVSGILQQKGARQGLDALIALDGIHVGYRDDHPAEPNRLNLAPFLDAARASARGELLFTITHSEVIPEGYASSTETADLLLEAAGGHREAVDPRDAPEHLAIDAAKGAVSKKLEKHMEPLTDARVGDLHVRGYRGVTPEHHMAHLLQMAATVMPELVTRWERSP